MTQTTNDNRLGTRTWVDTARLRGARGRGADVWTWTTRACAIGAVGAIGLLGWSTLRPLHGGAASAGVPAVTSTPSLGREGAGATLAQREAALAALSSNGNVFAEDGRAWVVAAEEGRKPDDTQPEATKRAAVSGGAAAPGAVADVASIVLAKDAPGAIKKRLEEIRLRGLYLGRDGWVAWIGPRGETRADPYRVGDTLENGEWRLAAIDDSSDRVILARGDMNFELRMYDGAAGGAVQPIGAPSATVAAAAAPEATPGMVRVRPTTREEMVAELLAAGVPRAEIEELLMLAATEEEAREPQPRTGVQAAPPMPPALADLLKAMAQGDAVGGEPAAEEAPRKRKQREK